METIKSPPLLNYKTPKAISAMKALQIPLQCLSLNAKMDRYAIRWCRLGFIICWTAGLSIHQEPLKPPPAKASSTQQGRGVLIRTKGVRAKESKYQPGYQIPLIKWLMLSRLNVNKANSLFKTAKPERRSIRCDTRDKKIILDSMLSVSSQRAQFFPKRYSNLKWYLQTPNATTTDATLAHIDFQTLQCSHVFLQNHLTRQLPLMQIINLIMTHDDVQMKEKTPFTKVMLLVARLCHMPHMPLFAQWESPILSPSADEALVNGSINNIERYLLTSCCTLYDFSAFTADLQTSCCTLVLVYSMISLLFLSKGSDRNSMGCFHGSVNMQRLFGT